MRRHPGVDKMCIVQTHSHFSDDSRTFQIPCYIYSRIILYIDIHIHIYIIYTLITYTYRYTYNIDNISSYIIYIYDI